MLLLIGCLVSFKFILNSLVSFLMEKYRIRFNLNYVLHKGNKKIICTIFLTKYTIFLTEKFGILICLKLMFYTRETNNTFFFYSLYLIPLRKCSMNEFKSTSVTISMSEPFRNV